MVQFENVYNPAQNIGDRLQRYLTMQKCFNCNFTIVMREMEITFLNHTCFKAHH